MSSGSKPPLSSVIARALSFKQPAYDSLSAIALYADCSQRLRRRIDDMIIKLDAEGWCSTEALNEIEVILSTVDSWIDDGAEKTLIWDEGCPHEGWWDTTLPLKLAEVDRKCVALRRFRFALRDAVHLIDGTKIAEQSAV